MPETTQTILVLGGYGLIGSAVCRHLRESGHDVVVCGRDPTAAAKALPGMPFRRADIARLSSEDWMHLLDGITTVVNCSGALQDGPENDLEALHHHAIAALGDAAAARGVRVIQISAAGVRPDHPTTFFASKARGDAALMASEAETIILRPGLVIGQSAYGGTMLLRMLAAVPLVQPLALPRTPIQTVALSDVARAVEQALTLTPGQTFDLVEDSTHSLADVIAAHRSALGFTPARAAISLPKPLMTPTAMVADALAHLGWRSPLRSTAIDVLDDGVRGDPGPWRTANGALKPMQETLSQANLGPEHRLQARAALLMPLAILTLAIFWLVSGLIGLIQLPQAAAHLTAVGWSAPLAKLSVGFWAVVDILLGLAVLHRRSAPWACAGMVVVSLVYIVSATMVTPHLWADPLGPLVKVLPAMMLAALTPSLMETR